jgi:hypothetical protein
MGSYLEPLYWLRFCTFLLINLKIIVDYVLGI